MTDFGADSRIFGEVIHELLDRGHRARFEARGRSMSPAIRDGESVEVTPVGAGTLREGDIVLAKAGNGFRMHRIVRADPDNDVFITRGDCGHQDDPPLTASQILGVAHAKQVRLGRGSVSADFRGTFGWGLRWVARGQAVLTKLASRIATTAPGRTLHRRILLLCVLVLFATAVATHGQVAVDATANATAELTGNATRTVTITHTTGAGANRLLIVSVSININNVHGTTVSGVRYNGATGTPLTLLGAHNDAGNTRRVEMWYLLNPASGTNIPIVVSVNVNGGNTVGVVAASTTFTGVDQTTPLGTFVSANGAGGGNSQLDVPSVVNGMVLDTLATGGNQTVTVPGWQTTEWNTRSGASATTDVTGTGSTRPGNPSLPFSETFSGTSNWSLGAVSINPSTADLSVATSVAAVAFGANSVYSVTVTNNGPSPANSISLTDAFADTNLNLVSYSATGGATCSLTTTINCTLATLNNGASFTLTVTVSTTTPGYYPNTATVTDSGTPPDPNTGNNTYVALAPVLTTICSDNSPPAGGTLAAGVLNTYFPGTASVVAGATSIPIGAANGTGTIAAGSLLLVIQMQDASINTSDTVAYGNGYTGTGFTTINNAGNYEFVTALGAVSGGFVSIAGAGANGGLVFGYTAAAASTTKGASTYQIVLVPQYSSATLNAGTTTAAAWNGSTGGVFALDVSVALALNNGTVSVSGLGFRGGAGMQLTGGTGLNTDYWQTSPATYTGAAEAGVDAAKGEGVAGTPEWVESGTTYLQTTTNYPSGTASDGSMARGAPGNAGGGGTDAHPAANDQNAGGGGGGNGGAGGYGGNSWNTNTATGGAGGSAFPATIDRVAMGGGGGAGTRNNSGGDTQASAGSAGGGIIFIRAGNFTGNGTLTANGAAAYIGTANDAGGGAGAGGTIVVLARTGGEGGLTLSATGGRGGDAWDADAYSLADRHGPGGGGGGGVIFVSAAPASATVTGGADGTTLTPGVSYGSTAGAGGTSTTTATLSQVTGIQSAAVCTTLADLKITKTHAGTFTRGGTASFTLTVQNVSTNASSGTVTVTDTLPLGLTLTTASGTGWTCSVSGQSLTCTRSDALAGGASYAAITASAGVSQTAPATVSNTATVRGGGATDPLKNTSTDTASVVSSADMGVTDAASPNPVAAGGNITYTQVVTNGGPSYADNATFATTTPANTTFVSISAPTGWSCVTPLPGGTGSVVCTNVSLATSTPNTITLVVNVNNGTANGTVITENVAVGSSDLDPTASNNTASASTIVGTTGPNLSVTNVATPDPVVSGNNVTFTSVVTNTGTSAITGATFAEFAPPGNATFVSVAAPAGWTCTGPPAFPASSCRAATVGAGVSGTFTVIYKTNTGLANGTAVTDTVQVNATNQSFGASSATATDIIEAATQALLGLNTAASPSTVLAGNNITYTQTITNSGQAAATTVSFTEATPANTTFQSVIAPSGWTCTTPAVGATGNVNCTNPSLGAGTSADIVVVVNVPATVTAASITATSLVSAANSPTANTMTVTPVSDQCDLTVTNSGTPSPVTAGSTITYTQTVYNHGPSYCSAATLTEATPVNTTFASVTASTTGGGTWNCPNTAPVSCSNPSVPPGSTGTITAVYTVNAGTAAGTIISDTALAATTTRDTNTTDNSATVNIAVASGTQADLSVTNSGSPSPATAGNNITYTQTVTNAGPATANAPVFTETLPANTTAVSLTGPGGWNCVLATLTCTDTTTMSPGTTNFSFVVTVNAGVATGTTITQTDSVSSSTGDPNSGNNSATVNIGVTNTADLSVTNTPNPVPVIAGNTITYTQVVSNAGPGSAVSVTLTDTLPSNTTATSLTGPLAWTCVLATLTCTDPALVSGAPATITYVVTVTAGTAAGTAISETATVSSNSTDTNSANNTAIASDVVATAAQADLVVTNVASPTTVAPGSNVTYTQTVTNNGPNTGTTASFTETTPTNTTFQSIVIPGGWTCPTLPAVGGTGTITCNDGSALGVGSANAATFTVVLQVGGTTPSGTNIVDTATASVANFVTGSPSTSASATVTVANANSADVAIVKAASPNPVTEGTLLTYTLAVTNNGPASATNVTVTDTLPSVLTYLSATTTQGSCSEAAGTVTCLLGTMANAGTATITILSVPGQPGIVSNTAAVSADQTDTNTANNSSTQTETITAPTRIALQSFKAFAGTDKFGASRAVLTWKTGGEAHNLGFNVYRELNGNRVRMNPSVIAGSALQMGGALPRHAGRSYVWMDPSAGTAGASYWLEDIDVNGTRSMYGPISPADGTPAESQATAAETRMLNQLRQAQPPKPGSQQSHVVESTASLALLSRMQPQRQFELAAHPAVKILVQHEGWYYVAQPDLVKAGLDRNVDPATLHLYAEAVEQPIRITGATAGPGGFGPQAAINFYGTGIDTEFSDTRVYWLVVGEGRYSGMPVVRASTGSNVAPNDFSATVELRQHLIYFSALITKNRQNFFGALVSSTATDQTLATPHLNTNSSQSPRLEISLQGVIAAFPHDVSVAVNGTPVGEITFTGQDTGTLSANIPPGVLLSGSNTVTLTAQNGDYDTSLVDYIRITYPHLYVADSDQLKFTGHAGDEINITGFTSAPVVLDITDPNRPMLLTPAVTTNSGEYSAAFQVPFTLVTAQHTLLAVAADQVASPAGVITHRPSQWHSAQAGADIAMVTVDDFAATLAPLVGAHRAEGKTSAIVPINDLYDEFNFGEHSPFAIRDFLQSAVRNWRKAPTLLLLNGRASFDPRNYLGMGSLDLIPTRIVPTATLMTASDDWFSDFTDTGMPTIATGRLPVGTVDEATSVIAKISGYERQSSPAAWMANALMIADKNDTESFTLDSQTVQAQLPASMQETTISVDDVGSTAARSQITAAINSGQLVVNYLGHGSEEQWSGSDIFDTNSVASLTNGSRLPVFLIMDCLNGLFQDVYAQPLGVTLLLAPNGGAAAVVASTGLNQPTPQTALDALIVSNALGANSSTVGESLLKAKGSINDVDARKTYVLFGDPAMRIKQASSGAAVHQEGR